MKKPRKVVLTLEITTSAPLSVLRRAKAYDQFVVSAPNAGWVVQVKQAQANVVED